MGIIQWHDSVYGMGIEVIDRQHRTLVEMINRAHDQAWQDTDPGALEQVIRDMATYAREHFATEEQLMRDAGYPDAESHLAQHAAFHARAEGYLDAVSDAHPPDPQEVFRFLAEWLSAHILEVDSALCQHLHSGAA